MSKEAENRIRSSSGRFGVVSLLLSLAVGIPILVIGFGLPTANHPISGLAVISGGISALFCYLFSSVMVFSGRRYFKDGHFSKTEARKAVRGIAVFWGGSILTSLLGCAALAMVIGSSGTSSILPEVRYTPLIVGYLVLLLAPCVLAGVNFFVARRLFRPSI